MQSIASALHSANQIGKAEVTVWLNDYEATNFNSTLTFGGEPSNNSTQSAFISHNLAKNKDNVIQNIVGTWALDLEQMKIGDSNQMPAGGFAIIDPMAYTQLPPGVFEYLLGKFLTAVPGSASCTTYADGSEYCSVPQSCESIYANLPDLSFKFDTTTYTLPPSSYTYSWSNSNTGYSECDLTIQSTPSTSQTQNYIVLGYQFAE